MTAEPPAPHRTYAFTLSLVLILLFAFAPVLSVLAASAIAAATGCDVNEGTTRACLAFGADIGGLLYSLFVAGWYVFFTLPLGVLALAAWAVALLVSRQRRQSPPTP